MLTFKETAEHYLVIQTTMSFCNTEVQTVKYTKDLKQKQVENDPWVNTTPSCRDWFNKYYLPKFNKEQ